MRIPSKQECFQLMRRMAMMEHIAAHSIMVCHVALYLADRLPDPRSAIDRRLVAASALLHDITKTRSFTTGENHAESGERLLDGQGCPEVGRVVGQHVRLNDYRNSGTPTAAEIVNYADKRVLHDKIVTLDQRMAYIVDRYGRAPDMVVKLRWIGEMSKNLETRLFARMTHAPEALAERIDPALIAADLAAYRQSTA